MSNSDNPNPIQADTSASSPAVDASSSPPYAATSPGSPRSPRPGATTVAAAATLQPKQTVQDNSNKETHSSTNLAQPNTHPHGSTSGLGAAAAAPDTSSPTSNPADSSLRQNNYLVASHSVRITKFGYAIDPVELRYAEITGKLTDSQRRNSEVSFDSSQLAHKILTLIRGYWSQPAFPRGRLMTAKQQQEHIQQFQQDQHSQMTQQQQQQQQHHQHQLYRGESSSKMSISPIDAMIASFKSTPFYPHKQTLGQMSKDKPLLPSGHSHRKHAHHHHQGLYQSRNSHCAGYTHTESTKTTSPSVKFFHRPKNTAVFSGNPPQQQHQAPTPGSTTPPSSSPSIAHFSPSTPPPDSPSITSTSQQQQQRSHGKQGSQRRKGAQLPAHTLYHSWIPKNKDLIAELVSELCQQLERIFMQEPRILSIESPCTVLGDIHGNLLDLRTYERSLWPKAPRCLTSNYLFLGDYVDRGEHSVECVLYLFAMKLIAPDRFFLLRGNHEVATIQRQYTFNTECEAKFGLVGRQLWRSFNRVFNVMPIAATIDKQIFCAHGGIPRSVTDISLLARDIPTTLDNPEFQSPAAWEILWNDPITEHELVAMIEMDNAAFSQPAPAPRPQIQIQQQQQQQQQQPQQPQTTASPRSPPEVQPMPPGADKQQASVPASDLPTGSGSNKTVGASIASSQEPLNSALSAYIRPVDRQDPAEAVAAQKAVIVQQAQQKQQKQAAAAQSTDQPTSTSATPPASTSSTTTPAANKSGSDTLSAVPSDTSSIASTSAHQVFNDGFVSNIKRGTAFLFSDKAIDHFLEVNKLSYVIRAHEVIPTGFAFHGDGRVITIFSSSQYCGLNNQAACALVDRDRIRIMRLDTGDAGE